MRCRSTKAILMIVGLAAWSAPAMAVTTEEIKSGLRDWLASALLQSTAGVSAALDGEVSVTAAGAGFQALLPPVRITLASGRGPVILVDPIAIDLSPLVGGGYAANWTMPDRVEMLAGDGTSTTISFGLQSGHGHFAPELGLMITSDLELLDIRAARPGRGPHLAVDSVLLSTRYDAVAPDLFDQSTEIQITGLTGLKEDGTEAVRIAAIALSGGARNVDLAAWRDLRASLRPANGHHPKSGGRGGDQADIAPGSPSALLTSLEGRHRISGARIDLGTGDLAIGEGSLDLSMDGLGSGSSTLAISFRLAELGLPGAIGPLTPHEVVVDLVLNGLPTDRLFDAMTSMVAGAGLAGSGHGLAMFGLYLQDAMMTSGAGIEVKELLLIGDGSRLRMAGAIKPTYAAPLGVIAELEMSIGGLGALVATARAAQSDDDTLRQLAVLQAVGTPGSDPDGMPVLRYALEINQQGQILLNGADLMPAVATAAP